MQPLRIHKLLLAIAFILVFVVSSVPLINGYLTVEEPLDHAEALVVMAGSKSERLPVASQLYKNGIADKILLTNDGVFSAYSKYKHRNLYQIEWAELDLIKMGIPEKSIFKLSYTYSGTIHDALNTRKAVMNMGIKSIIIVTSDYHSRRSLWVFKRVFRGLSVKIGIHPVKSSLSSNSFMNQFRILFYEMAKLIYYFCRY